MAILFHHTIPGIQPKEQVRRAVHDGAGTHIGVLHVFYARRGTPPTDVTVAEGHCNSNEAPGILGSLQRVFGRVHGLERPI